MSAEKPKVQARAYCFFPCHRNEIADAPGRQESWAILQYLSLSHSFAFPLVFISTTDGFEELSLKPPGVWRQKLENSPASSATAV